MKYLAILLFSFLFISKAEAQTVLTDSASATVDSAASYGFIPERPIKVGGLLRNGAASQRKYLESLRDAQGAPVSYKRKGSCCAYRSENGINGIALLDRYEVKYRDADNKEQTVILYISFYDFEELKPVKGFTMVVTGE